MTWLLGSAFLGAAAVLRMFRAVPVEQDQTLPATCRTNQVKWDFILQVFFSLNLPEIGGRLAVLVLVPVLSYVYIRRV